MKQVISHDLVNILGDLFTESADGRGSRLKFERAERAIQSQRDERSESGSFV